MEYNTPQKIFEKYNEKVIDKISAVEHLIALLENSENVLVRIESLEILEKIGMRTDRIFRLLENFLISDSNEKIRILAASALKNMFLDKALPSMKHALQHEKSKNCLYFL